MDTNPAPVIFVGIRQSSYQPHPTKMNRSPSMVVEANNREHKKFELFDVVKVDKVTQRSPFEKDKSSVIKVIKSEKLLLD